MKKLMLMLVLTFLSSFAGFADDGDIHTGGKTCTENCPSSSTEINTGIQSTDTESTDIIYSEISEALELLFG